MLRPMMKSKLARWARREASAILKLSPWIVVALLLVVAFWGRDTAALSGLFQSPPTLTPTSPATNTPEPSATLPPTEVPAETPTPPPTETAILTPTATTELTATVTDTPQPTATDTPQPTATEASLTPAVDETPPTDEASPEEGNDNDRQRYAEGDSGLKFEWPMLFDSVALGLSYVWLCCGVLVLVGLPLIFIILWIASRSRGGPQE